MANITAGEIILCERVHQNLQMYKQDETFCNGAKPKCRKNWSLWQSYHEFGDNLGGKGAQGAHLALGA